MNWRLLVIKKFHYLCMEQEKKIVKNKQNRAKKTQFVFQLKSIGDPHLHCNSQVRACSTKYLYWCFYLLSLVLREQRSQTEGGRFRPHYTHGGPPTGLQGPRFLGLIMTLLPPIPQKRNSPARLCIIITNQSVLFAIALVGATKEPTLLFVITRFHL